MGKANGNPGGPKDPLFAQVVALYHYNDANGATSFADSSSYNNTFVGGGTASNAQSLFPGRTSFFAQNLLGIATKIAAYTIGTNDFTIEFAIRPFSRTAAIIYCMTLNAGLPGNAPIFTFPALNTGKLRFQQAVGTFIETAGNVIPTANIWYQLAYDRAAGTGRLYVNGAVVASGVDTTNYTGVDGSSPCIRVPSNTSGLTSTYYNELRVTNGTARYQGAYQVATKPFPDR